MKKQTYADLQKQFGSSNNKSNNDNDESELTPQQVEKIYAQLSTKVIPIDHKSNLYL